MNTTTFSYTYRNKYKISFSNGIINTSGKEEVFSSTGFYYFL